MRTLALLLCALLAVESAAETTFVEPSTITITARRPGPEATLKALRGGGGGMAGAGLGLMGYVVFVNSFGPMGWAASLVFMGGMTAYLSHRKLRGQDDFHPSPAAPVGEKPSA